jgi:hypothetical protein
MTTDRLPHSEGQTETAFVQPERASQRQLHSYTAEKDYYAFSARYNEWRPLMHNGG